MTFDDLKLLNSAILPDNGAQLYQPENMGLLRQRRVDRLRLADHLRLLHAAANHQRRSLLGRRRRLLLGRRRSDFGNAAKNTTEKAASHATRNATRDAAGYADTGGG